MINLLTRDPQVNHDFQLIQILFTDAGMATESKIEFEGVGILQYADYKDGSCPTWVLSGKCEAVAGTGTGIFADAFGGRTIFTSPWSHQLPQQEGIAEWCRSGLRICPATWTFLFEKQISDSLQYAILKETL